MENFSYISDPDQIIKNDKQNDLSKYLAVDVKNVEFQYRRNVKVLDKISLQIPRGKIFALLGPNGCGKTTLIRSILGRLKYKSGSIQVFGVRPGSKDSDIPGPGVGYMPQDLALFEEFTIREILKYYGNLYHLKGEELQNRIDQLMEILNLPEKSRPINKLSGGQQRRVSIAITMIHRPKLIILDEPTVGVDSLLRCRIWQYLEMICQKFGQTVLITTHYIEEAKTASNVAFMNAGTVLKQSSPQKLLKDFNCKTLEEVFLILCQNRIISIKSKSPENNYQQNYHEINCEINEEILGYRTIDKYINHNISNKSIDFLRIKAMLWKYYILTLRRPLFLFLFYILPIIVLSVMKFSIGQKPHNIPIAVHNSDRNPKLSQLFLESIDPRYLHLFEYKDNTTAYKSVVDGINTVSLVFSKNFTESFELRLTDLYQMTDQELDSSQIKVYADFSNSIIGNMVYNSLFKAFENFLKALSTTYGPNLYRYFTPIFVEKAIYGWVDLNLNIYISPGLMLALAHVLPMIISAFQIIYDRKNTSLERVFVAGVKPIEFFIAHMIQNIILIITQVSVSMIIAFGILGNVQIGSYLEVYIMFVLQGLQGMAIGLLISLILSDEVSVGIGLTGLMLPVWIMSGVIWPIQSIPYYFRYFTDLSPITQPLEALRSIMLRGWTYHRPEVMSGYIISIIYTIILSFLNLILFHTHSDKAFSLHTFIH